MDRLLVRKFELKDNRVVQHIFYDGLMEMVPDTAFRGLRHHPESLLLYAAMTVMALVITKSWWVVGLLPAIVVCLRYFYSRRVIHGYLKQAMSTDMANIEEFYMKSPGSCFWVAVLEGEVVGIVAAVGQQEVSGGAVVLQRMCVEQRHRKRGVGVALGRKVLEFAAHRGYSSVILGTTAYALAAHHLYQSLGFRCVGVTNGYATPGGEQSLLEQVFYRVRHHHYSLDVKNSKIPSRQH
ncbi:N-acetylaspartate synthetase-like [Archocentrus centrarchus]|uniref:N-acetylaspartate synthetase-like n=1 Tax=Archocentrus centrarchus TaxID=63155 RepID=UPI0011EA1D62|nr:N-acetylaspartate synthetase-like [Archocentrus centrarchus]